jgi:cardiolipin synthase
MKQLLTLPNLLTLLRLLMTPPLVVSLARRHYAPAFVWLVAAGITDVLDGWLARRFRWISPFGAILDPVADKALLVGAYLALAMAGATPLWLTALVLGRDAAILLFAAVMLALGKRRSFPPSVWGKLSTLCQVTTASFVIGARAFAVAAVEPWLPALFALTAAATAWSGLHYAWQAARWREPRNPVA